MPQSAGFNFQWDCRLVTAKTGVKNHQHTELELNYVASGSLVYQYGAIERTIQGREIALFWAALPHHIMTTAPDTRLYWLTIPFSAFLTWQLPTVLTIPLIDGDMLKFAHSSLAKRCDILFESWHTEIGASGTAKQAIAMREVEAFMNRLSLHLPIRSDSAQKQASFTKAQKIARYITRHYTELLTIEQIAQSVNLNPNYAMTLFRQHFNLSILEYLTQFRTAHAQRLLLFSDTPVNKIAHESGFGSISQFYATFKQAVGTTPHRYRHFKDG